MAVYVVMSFDEDDDAKRFVKDVIRDGGVSITDSDDILTGVYVETVVKKATMFCDESDGHRKNRSLSGYTRGKKYGWWCCALCGKPSQKWSESLLDPAAHGTNLLPVDAVLGQGLSDHRRLDGWNSAMEWSSII